MGHDDLTATVVSQDPYVFSKHDTPDNNLANVEHAIVHSALRAVNHSAADAYVSGIVMLLGLC